MSVTEVYHVSYSIYKTFVENVTWI